jgi:type 1 glutamine amidotransferase/sugar phosphate isomerase/epimerase
MRTIALTIVLGSLIGWVGAQAPTSPEPPANQAGSPPAAGRKGGGGRGGFTGPSLSVRPPDQGLARTSAATLLGWRVGIRTDAFGPLTFSEAAAKADASGMAFVEGVSTQKVSADIPKNLDYNLTPAEVDKVKARLNELRLRMPAYYAETIPADQISRRNLFEFARSLGIDMIVCSPERASLADLDKLANEFMINVAVMNLNPKGALVQVEQLSRRTGFSVDLGAWQEAGTKPIAGLAQLKDRVLAASLRDRSALGAKGRDVALGAGVADPTAFLLQLSRLQPPNRPVGYPPAPGHDGGGQRAEVKPLFFAFDATGSSDVSVYPSQAAAYYDTAVRPAIAYRVDELARLTPISTPERVPADQRQRIDAAIPRQALVKPKKTRKLLVVDLAINGSFYHGSTPLGNLSLELMSRYTAAFTPLFSNDLDNLKFPKIKQYDGVFLNQIQGDVFADHDAIEGLTRYVREGGGVAGLHAATWASQDVPDFGEMMGATSGAHKYNGEPGALRVDDPNSPLTKQFGSKPFEFFDEFYHYLPTGPYSREKLHVLLSLDPARKDLSGNQYTNRPDNDYGMAWIRSYGKGRVFNVGLGHRPEFYETPSMQQMVLAGVQFILGDLEADTTPSARLATKK